MDFREFKIYPNPGKGHLVIETTQLLQNIQLYDMFGQQIVVGVISGALGYDVNLPVLPSGV